MKMNINPWSVVLAVVGGLIVAGLTAWVRGQRLILFVPRLFSYSGLVGKNGQLAELSVMNRGFKNEEQIEVSMSPTLQYEVVGSTNNDVSLSGNKLIIPRVGAGDDVTTILLVEGGTFSASEISNCLSKESKGIIIGKFEQVPMNGPQRVGVVATLVVVPAFVGLIIWAISSYFDQQISTVGAAATEKATIVATASATQSATASATQSATANAVAAAKANVTVNDWSVAQAYLNLGGPLTGAFQQGKIQFKINIASRKKDIASVATTISNNSEYVLKVSLSMDTQRSQERIPAYLRSLSDILVVPGATITKSINVVIPQKSTNAEDQKVYVQVFIDEAGGDTLKLVRTVTVPLIGG